MVALTDQSNKVVLVAAEAITRIEEAPNGGAYVTLNDQGSRLYVKHPPVEVMKRREAVLARWAREAEQKDSTANPVDIRAR